MATLEQRMFAANRAKEVLDNEAFTGALEAIKQEIKEAWEQSPARDSEGREKLWLMLSLAIKLENQLKTTLETGKLAELDLKHKRSILERVTSAIS